MATTYSANLRLEIPAVSDRNWNVALDDNRAALDALSPIGGLAVTTTETPSTTLNVRVTAGVYQQSNGQVATYAGVNPFAITLSSTLNLWLTDAGTLTSGSSWPAAPHVRLATVTAGATTITGISDARLSGHSAGASRLSSTKTVTAVYTATAADSLIRADATSAAFTVTLPAANTVPGMTVRILRINATNTVTIGSTSLINGASTLALATQWLGKTLVADGTSNTWSAF